MSDKAHRETDKELARIERRLAELYEEAGEEAEARLNDFMAKFAEKDDAKRALVESGKLSEADYAAWRQGQMMQGKHWTNLANNMASELSGVNKTAQDYINGRLPQIYALNYNGLAEVFEGAVRGLSWELVNADVIRNLAISDKTLLPYKYIDGVKDVRWNTKLINSQVFLGIQMGESIPKIAARMRNVASMDRVSAVRNARTCVTSAECKGRQDGYERAAKDGIKMQREWIATNDGRTRHSHRLLDGKLAEVDKPFDSELGPIMYPGDPEADPRNVYNCRCTMGVRIISIGKTKINDPLEKADDRELAPDAIEQKSDSPKKVLTTEKKDGKIKAEKKKTKTSDAVKNDIPIGSDAFNDEKHNALLRTEMINNGYRKERAVIYDANGNVKFKVNGDDTSVTFSPQQMKEMKGCVITHNHPNNAGFSVADIAMLKNTGASEIRASTKYGTYVFQRPKRWSREIGTKEKIEDQYYNYLDDALIRYKDKAAQDGLPLLAYYKEAEEEGMREFAKAFGINFKIEKYNTAKLQIKLD